MLDVKTLRNEMLLALLPAFVEFEALQYKPQRGCFDLPKCWSQAGTPTSNQDARAMPQAWTSGPLLLKDAPPVCDLLVTPSFFLRRNFLSDTFAQRLS
jgi:hypothetical protein